MLKIIVIVTTCLLFLGFGIAELHIKDKPVHKYPLIESPLHNTKEAPRGG